MRNASGPTSSLLVVMTVERFAGDTLYIFYVVYFNPCIHHTKLRLLDKLRLVRPIPRSADRKVPHELAIRVEAQGEHRRETLQHHARDVARSVIALMRNHTQTAKQITLNNNTIQTKPMALNGGFQQCLWR